MYVLNLKLKHLKKTLTIISDTYNEMEIDAKPNIYANLMENRKKVCVSCGIKCTYATKDGITPQHLKELIRKHQNYKFDVNDHRFSVYICRSG